MNITEVEIQARLEGVYSMMRSFQVWQNYTKTPCIGSGHCCEIGLRVSLMEAWNIAQKIKSQFWIEAESVSKEYAEFRLKEVKEKLLRTLTEDQAQWDPYTEETPGHKCVFWNELEGCTIYEFRPMVCRAYGVTSPVDEGCPRKRLQGGGVEILPLEQFEPVISEFDKLIELWGANKPDLDYSIHIAAGVLRFLLDEKEFSEIVKSVDVKFFLGVPGYKHQMRLRSETPVSIERK